MKNSLTKMFYFLSKTDTEVIKKCTKETQLTQMSIGMIVLLAGMFAFASGFFAIHFISGNYFIAGLVAILYAVAIITFDREIVSGTGKKALILRIPFAIILGLVISFPLEIKVLQDAITVRAIKIATIEAKENFDLKMKNYENEKKDKQDALEKSISDQKDSIATLERNRDSEKKRGGCYSECKKIEIEIKEANNQLGNFNTELRLLVDNKSPEYIKDKAEAEKERQLTANLYHDFLSQAIALEQITTNEDPNHKWYEQNSAWWIAMVLKLFFVSLELMGVLIKLFMKYNEYHAYLDCRRALNVQKVNAVGNLFLEEIKKDPIASLEVDYTDRIVKGMEDRSDEHTVDNSIVVPGHGIKEKA